MNRFLRFAAVNGVVIAFYLLSGVIGDWTEIFAILVALVAAAAWLLVLSRSSPKVRRILLVCLLSSVIVLAGSLFLLAFLRGADFVAVLPQWVWLAIILYSFNSIGFAILTAPRHLPLQPRPGSPSDGWHRVSVGR
jgi:hypothetical protein